MIFNRTDEGLFSAIAASFNMVLKRTSLTLGCLALLQELPQIFNRWVSV